MCSKVLASLRLSAGAKQGIKPLSQEKNQQQAAIIIPAFNEAGTIADVVKSVKAYGTVIVVDDGSADGTPELAEKAGAVVVRQPKNLGYDKALQAGFRKAAELGKDAAICIDADGQHPAGLIPGVISPLLEGKADAAFTVRPKPARMAEAIFRRIAKKRYGIGDILCGMKAFRLDVYKDYDSLYDHPTFATAAAIAAARDGRRIIQTDIPVSPRADTPRIGRLVKANISIYKGMRLALDLTKEGKQA